MGQIRFSISNRLKSFKYAFNGLLILLKEEHNSRVHLLAAIIAIGLGFILKINSMEWMAILMVIGMVISFEMLNSAIENLADYVSPEKKELIKKTKDLAAGAVLWSAIIALVVGIIVFVPKIFPF